jgi:dihydrofolate synthase/folylpolyglutamate synthase
MRQIDEKLEQIDRDLAAMYGRKVPAPHGDAVGEMIHIILTQNTSDANSDRTFAALRAAYSTWEQLAEANVDDVEQAIRMGGLARIKAARILEALARLRAERGAITLVGIERLPKMEAFEQLTEIDGVGPKTAACVLLFALGVPVFPVDTHVHRVANRLGLVRTKSPAATQAALMPVVPEEITYQLHMNMVEHGRRTCKAARPRCERCLLASYCLAAQAADAERNADRVADSTGGAAVAAAAMEYLASLARFGVKPGLERTAALLEWMRHPERRMAHIHVAGTNGKGSTAVMIERVLRQAGYRTGLYTSPHLQRYTERIRVCGEEISAARFAELIHEVKPLVARAAADPGVGEPTEFEVATAACFSYFAERNVDVAVVEVGLGGRYDATNLVSPIACVITHVGMDHMDRLGNTLGEIAADKSGIIKPGVPVVTSPQEPEAAEVIAAAAAAAGAPLVRVEQLAGPPAASAQSPGLSAAGARVPFELIDVAVDSTRVRVDLTSMPRGKAVELGCGLIGVHQAANCATAVAALELVSDAFPVSDAELTAGIALARNAGRFEIVQTEPYIIVLDGAHNPDGAQALAATMGAVIDRERPRVMLLGLSRDKNLDEMVGILAPHADLVIATAAAHTRSGARDPGEIVAAMAAVGVPGRSVPAEEAVAAARAAVEEIGARSLVVTGSLYLVGQLRAEFVSPAAAEGSE